MTSKSVYSSENVFNGVVGANPLETIKPVNINKNTGIIESTTTLYRDREIHLSIKDLQSATRLEELWILQILDMRMGFPRPFLSVVFDYFSHSCLKNITHQKCTLDVTFLDCLALTFCGVIGELLLEWACLTLQVGTTFFLPRTRISMCFY